MIPESPRWLIVNGRKQEAFKILCDLHNDSTNADQHMTARKELLQITEQCALDRQMEERLGKWALLTQPTYRKRLFCGMLTFFLAQSTGVLVINNYQVLLYNGLGLHDDMPLLLYALYVTVAALMNVLSAFIIDKVGRRKLIIFGLIACSLDLACEAAMVAKFSGTDNKVGNGLGVFFLFLYVTIYAVTLDATEYVYCAEIFPTHVRAMGMGASIFSQAATTVLYTELAATAFGEIGWKYYLVFIIVPLMGVLLVWKYFPETKGLSLEEIAAAFGEDVVIGRTPTDDQEQGTLDGKLAEDSKDFLAASETQNLVDDRKDTLEFAAQVVA
jgi:MFS family permease